MSRPPLSLLDDGRPRVEARLKQVEHGWKVVVDISQPGSKHAQRHVSAMTYGSKELAQIKLHEIASTLDDAQGNSIGTTTVMPIDWSAK